MWTQGVLRGKPLDNLKAAIVVLYSCQAKNTYWTRATDGQKSK
jgi:hypothetical protein